VRRTRAVTSVLVVVAAIVINIRSRKKIAYPDASTLVIAHPAVTIDGRMVELEGATNMRDLGGYKTTDGRTVKRGLIYRSGSLTGLTEHDKKTLATLGVKVVCDLRSVKEATDAPDILLAEVAYHNLPINDDTPTWDRLRTLLWGRPSLTEHVQKLYTDLLIDRNAHIFGQTLHVLAQENNYPAIFHCAAGKDRTGIVAALLLLTLGIPEEVVIADYSLSNQYYEDFQRIAMPHIEHLRAFNVTVDDIYPLVTADPEVLRSALEHIRLKYGSIEAYLTGPAGLEQHTLQRLRDALLEP
jgi:protein-tyrosine phosphatase